MRCRGRLTRKKGHNSTFFSFPLLNPNVSKASSKSSSMSTLKSLSSAGQGPWNFVLGGLPYREDADRELSGRGWDPEWDWKNERSVGCGVGNSKERVRISLTGRSRINQELGACGRCWLRRTRFQAVKETFVLGGFDRVCPLGVGGSKRRGIVVSEAATVVRGASKAEEWDTGRIDRSISW